MPDRFKNYDPEVRRLVLQFEASQKSGEKNFFDADQLEIIIDFYLETLNSTNQKISRTANQQTQQVNTSINQHPLTLLQSSIEYAESLFPHTPGIRLRRAHFLSIQGRYDLALKILLQLENEDPEDGDVQYALGTIYSALDQSRRAIQYYLKASRDGYQLGTVYGNIADEYYRLGRLEESLRYYKKSVAHAPEDERSLLSLSSTFDELNQNAAAVAFFKQFVQKHPYNKTLWFCLGRSLMYYYDELGGREPDASLSDQQTNNTTPPQATQQRSPHHLLLQAIDAFQFVLTIDDSHFDSYILIAECYQMLNRSQDAVSTLRESLNYASDPANVLFSIASIYKEGGNYQTASIYLRQATDRDPYFSEAWLNLAECYNAMGDTSNAEELYQRALGMNDETDDFWLLYADFLIEQHRFNDAILLLQKGIVNADFPHPFNIRLALCYFKTNRRNLLFSILIDCSQNNDNLHDLLHLCPEMLDDLEVMNIINA